MTELVRWRWFTQLVYITAFACLLRTVLMTSNGPNWAGDIDLQNRPIDVKNLQNRSGWRWFAELDYLTAFMSALATSAYMFSESCRETLAVTPTCFGIDRERKGVEVWIVKTCELWPIFHSRHVVQVVTRCGRGDARGVAGRQPTN